MHTAAWARRCCYGLVAGPETVHCHSSRALATSPPQWIGFFLGSPLGEVSGIQGQLLLYAVSKWHLKVRLSSDQPEMPATWRKGPS